MKRYRHIFIFVGLLLTLPATASTDVTTTIKYDTRYCYAYAMIGEDSVINSRLGLLPEQLMELARLDSANTTTAPRYSPVLLRTILDAFLWQESPQHYAQSILHNCNSYQAKKQNA